jgi:hypothetical protein
VLGVIVCALSALALCGCQIAGFFAKTAYETGDHKVFAEYEGLRGHDFAVMVQADQVLRASDPQLAVRMTNALTRMLSIPDVGATGVVPGPMVLEFEYNNPSWTSWSYQRIADEFTVDRLVFVDLYEYRLTEPGNRHVWDAVGAARVSVYEAGSGYEEFSFSREVQVHFPDEMGVTRTERPEQFISEGLEVRLLNRIAWLFFDHDEPNTITY